MVIKRQQEKGNTTLAVIKSQYMLWKMGKYKKKCTMKVVASSMWGFGRWSTQRQYRYAKTCQDKVVTIARDLADEEEKSLLQCLRNNQDVFAWSKNDLKGVPRHVIEHKLETDPKFPPKKQKLRVLSPEKEKAIQVELQKLLDAGVIRQVQFSTWLSNVVMVPKKSGEYRMCIDFTLLNKACPKDDYPLS